MGGKDAYRHIGFTVEASQQRGSTTSFRSRRATYKLTGHVIAAIAIVAATLALSLLWSLVVTATIARETRSDVT